MNDRNQSRSLLASIWASNYRAYIIGIIGFLLLMTAVSGAFLLSSVTSGVHDPALQSIIHDVGIVLYFVAVLAGLIAAFGFCLSVMDFINKHL
jgi:hypothetical protein